MLSSLAPSDLFNIRQKMAARRLKAAQDAAIRQFRTDVLFILYECLPKQQDMKRRTQLIETIADGITELFPTDKFRP